MGRVVNFGCFDAGWEVFDARRVSAQNGDGEAVLGQRFGDGGTDGAFLEYC